MVWTTLMCMRALMGVVCIGEYLRYKVILILLFSRRNSLDRLQGIMCMRSDGCLAMCWCWQDSFLSIVNFTRKWLGLEFG
ncbi:hypothetical protein GDO78_013374 [Eleutherodactylus coqui]|uniref:Uncharacterized protein n=1 Tax=Eleutherodactylus coqui TaxID=57060 RepID=A0A8J6K3Y2_ELECQ|nr:hypothetical protein GDO78_013374 [Eleutherodactylus coqui]